MPIFIILAIVLLLAAIAVFGAVKNKNMNIQQAAKYTSEPPSLPTYFGDDNIIERGRAGLFKIDEPAPDQTLLSQEKYSIEETTVFPEGMPQKQYIVSRDGENLLTLNMSPDLSKIWDIYVVSQKIKTKEDIGVGSTIFDFMKAYPNYNFWYSAEEGEHFVLNTSSDQNSPQFLLDRSGLLDPEKSFYPTKATISDFTPDAKIIRVRVYYSP